MEAGLLPAGQMSSGQVGAVVSQLAVACYSGEGKRWRSALEETPSAKSNNDMS